MLSAIFCSGSLQIYDGMIAHHALLGTFCDLQAPVTLSSTTSIMFVRLYINISVGEAEFLSSYRIYCGAVYRWASELELESNAIEFYSRDDYNTECTWTIIGEVFERLVLNITLLGTANRQNCDNFYLKVLRILHECSCFIEFIKRVEEKKDKMQGVLSIVSLFATR